jgi:hypothetical protein
MACVKPRHGLRTLALLLSSGLVMVACNTASSLPSPSPTATRAAAKTSSCSAPPPLNATLRITSPKPGVVVAAGAVTVAFEVTGAELVAFMLAKCPNDYHVHVALDRDVSTYLGTDVAAPLTADFKHTPFTANDEPRSVTFSDVAAGQHTTFAWLAFADHTSVRPAVSSSVTFVAR